MAQYGYFMIIWLLLFLKSTCEKGDSYGSMKTSTSKIWTDKVAEIHQQHCQLSHQIKNATQCVLPWQYCNETDGRCHCGKTLYNIIHCAPYQVTSVLTCHCVTYDKTSGLTEIGSCIYQCQSILKEGREDPIYLSLPKNVSELNANVCEPFNRNGTLCGKCKDGFHPLAYSFNMSCVSCQDSKSNWWKFLLVAFLPLTFFYFIILFLKINIASSNLYGFVYYSQATVMPALARLILLLSNDKPIGMLARLTSVLYGIWNLDFFRSLNLGICLGTDTLQTLALNLIVGVYPLLLMVLSYLLIALYDRNFRLLKILWKPFQAVFVHFCRNWEIRTSIIDSFATFFLLSNVNILSASCDLLAPVTVHQINSAGQLTHSRRLFYDATIVYFGDRHLPYAILAIVVGVLFVVFPILLLILYPLRCFQKFLNLFPFRWYILHTFMDSFQGCYKNGTEPGTRDCRWFASMFFILRFLIIIIGGVSMSSSFFPISSILYTLFVVLLIGTQPFKTSVSHYTTINAIFLLLIALLYASITGMLEADNIDVLKMSKFFVYVTAIVTVLPLLYISAIILHWMYSHRTFFGLQLINRFCAWRRGYVLLE